METVIECKKCERPAKLKGYCRGHYSTVARRARQERIKQGINPDYYRRPEPTPQQLKEREEFWFWVKKELGL